MRWKSGSPIFFNHQTPESYEHKRRVAVIARAGLNHAISFEWQDSRQAEISQLPERPPEREGDVSPNLLQMRKKKRL